MTTRFSMGCAVALFCAWAPSLWAQSDTQTFDVTVPSRVTITAPAATVTLAEGNSDTDTVFAAQTWTIVCNGDSGGTATFSTANVFVHTVNASRRADVQLDLALGTTVEGDWAVTTASDTSDYSASDLTASVAAASSQPSDAELDLTVRFKNSNSSLLASGTYQVVVTGTLVAN